MAALLFRARVPAAHTSAACATRNRVCFTRVSTRATTPDLTVYAPRNQSSISDLSVTESQSTLANDADEGESKMLEKTFAHELLHNEEGQITGGTLQALVERLTTHDSTPDSIFVSTFYLTFRLFARPVELAKALVDRFDYVGESPHIAGPVRLPCIQCVQRLARISLEKYFRSGGFAYYRVFCPRQVKPHAYCSWTTIA